MAMESAGPRYSPAVLRVIEPMAVAYFRQLEAEYRGGRFAVKFLGKDVAASGGAPEFTLVIESAEVLEALIVAADELTLGELYVRRELDIEGDMEAAFAFADWLVSRKSGVLQQAGLRALRAVLPKTGSQHGKHDELAGEVHSRARDRAAIARHYDISNDFYRLWLDDRMEYSAGYFDAPGVDLDAAQRRKLDYICRKLRLEAGEKLLDVGCGWGGLVMFAAAQYGVRAEGITLSVRQEELACERIHAAGLEDRCAVRICDYRDVRSADGYDKIVSVGMFEHVGESMLGEYFGEMHRLLRAGGTFLNSGIAASATYKREGRSFIDEYVFPDGELVPLYLAVERAEECGFDVRDVEDLSEHYALTLDRWVRRLEEHAEAARELTSDATYRTWKLYMAASAHGFRTGRVRLYDMLLSKPDGGRSHVPLTRSDWYRA